MRRKAATTFIGIAAALSVAATAPATAEQPATAAAASSTSQLAQGQANWDEFVRMATGYAAGAVGPGGSSLPDLQQLSSALSGIGPAAQAGGGSNLIGQINGREYLLWVPASYSPARPTPLVVAYSALNNPAEAFREYSKLRESGMGREALIVYPRAIGMSWEGMPTAKTGPGEDIGFVRAITAQLQREYNVDRSRIYATGMSQGGGMAAISACHMSDIFAGVAAVSGAFYAPVNMNCANTPVAFMDIHGMADTVTPYYGGERWGAPILSVQTMFVSYERRNACAGGVDRHPAGPNATRITARGCRKPVEVIQVHGGGHVWFNVPSAADEVWGFLARQRK